MKTNDPLAGVEVVKYYCMDKCGTDFVPEPNCRECGAIIVRLLPEPAVRLAMVEWLNKQAQDEWERGDKFSGSESLAMMADRLEAGGGE